MNLKVSQSYLGAATLQLRDGGKHAIIPPPPKKSAMDKAHNREARIYSHLCTNYWLSGVYLKRIGKRVTLYSHIHNNLKIINKVKRYLTK
jgi:hypothetical protein